MLNNKVIEDTLSRLSKIKGQIEGIENMIKDKRYCVDIVMQVASAESALHSVSEVILRNHLETCVEETFKSSSKEEKKEKIDELIKIYKHVRIK